MKDIPQQVQELILEAIAKKPTRIEHRMNHGRVKFRFSAKVITDEAHRESGKAKDVLPYLSETLRTGKATVARLFVIKDLQVRILINLDPPQRDN